MELTTIEKEVLNRYQRNFPLTPKPYEVIAQQLDITEEKVFEVLTHLENLGIISRIGAVIQPKRVGESTLAALSVPPERITEIVKFVNAYTEINHNYEREHEHYNLWFVITAASDERLQEILRQIGEQAQQEVLFLPLVKEYHIDLGFTVS